MTEEEYLPVICGGWNYADFNSNCYSIGQNKNKTTLISSISQLRWYSSGTVLKNCEVDLCTEFLWITGGAFHQRYIKLKFKNKLSENNKLGNSKSAKK